MFFYLPLGKLTGYTYKCILSWIYNKKIISLKKDNKHLIPKKILIDFISSHDYNNVNSMSEKHRDMLIEFEKIQTKNIRKENHDE